MPKSASLQWPSLSRRTLSNFRSLKGNKQKMICFGRHEWINMWNSKGWKLISHTNSIDASYCLNVSLCSAFQSHPVVVVVSNNIWRRYKFVVRQKGPLRTVKLRHWQTTPRPLSRGVVTTRKSLTHSDDYSGCQEGKCVLMSIFISLPRQTKFQLLCFWATDSTCSIVL